MKKRSSGGFLSNSGFLSNTLRRISTSGIGYRVYDLRCTVFTHFKTNFIVNDSINCTECLLKTIFEPEKY